MCINSYFLDESLWFPSSFKNLSKSAQATKRKAEKMLIINVQVVSVVWYGIYEGFSDRLYSTTVAHDIQSDRHSATTATSYASGGCQRNHQIDSKI